MPESWGREPQATTMTAPHRQLIAVLEEVGFAVEVEVEVGPYSLDCYVREVHLGFEADGPLHRGGRQRRHDAGRDAWILEHAGIPIMRVFDRALATIEGRERLRDSIIDFVDDFIGDLNERRERGWDQEI